MSGPEKRKIRKTLKPGFVSQTSEMLGLKELGSELVDISLFIAPAAHDTLHDLNRLTAMFGKRGVLEKKTAKVVGFIESFAGLDTEALVDQAMMSIETNAQELTSETASIRGPITPSIHLLAAEKVISTRSPDQKIDFLRKLFTKCRELLANDEYKGKRDAEGMIVARMIYEATEGIVVKALEKDKDQGLKGEHTVDQAIRVLNEAVQADPKRMIPALGVYVSTDMVPVFEVPKSEEQMTVANELLFLNRAIFTQKAMLDPTFTDDLVTGFTAGWEFLEHEKVGSARKAGEEGKLQRQWHRISWAAMVQSLHPGLFYELNKLADGARAENRFNVKPEKYHYQDRDFESDPQGRVTSPLVAFALTNHFRPVKERMQIIEMTEDTPKAPKAKTSPRSLVKAVKDGLFPDGSVRKIIGDWAKLIDKYGPYNVEAHLGIVPTMISKPELKEILRRLPRGNKISEARLTEISQQLGHVTQSFLESTFQEAISTASDQEKVNADFAALQLVFLGRALQSDVMRDYRMAGDLYQRLNRFVIDVISGETTVSVQVREAVNYVFETCVPYYPETARVEFFKQFIDRGLANPAIFNRWESFIRPLALREQSFIPRHDGEVNTVRVEVATQALLLAKRLLFAFPDLKDKPELLMDLLNQENGGFPVEALRLAWVIGNRLGFDKITPEEAVKGEKRLPEYNTVLTELTEMIIKRLGYELARKLRKDAPIAIGDQLNEVVEITRKLSGDLITQEKTLEAGFAKLTGIFETDLIIQTEEGGLKHLKIPKSAMPSFDTDENGIINLATGENKQKLLKLYGEKLIGDESGEIATILKTAKAEVRGQGDMSERILERAFGRAKKRDVILMEQAVSLFEGILGRPVEEEPQGKEEGSPQPKKREASPRIRRFVSGIWQQYPGYGRAIGLLSLLTANNQALSNGATGIAQLVATLTESERAEVDQAIELAEKSGSIDTAVSLNEILQAISATTLGRVQSVGNALEIADGFRTSVFETTKDSLAHINRLEGLLATEMAEQHEQDIIFIRTRLEARKLQLNEAARFVKEQLPRILTQMAKEKEAMVSTLVRLRTQIAASREEVIAWIIDQVDPNKDTVQLRLRLQTILYNITGTDQWTITAPSIDELVKFTGLTVPAAKT